MSYASEVKKELTGITSTTGNKNARAELMALIRMNGSIGLANHAMILNVQTESPAIARRIYSLIKQLYKVESDILVRKKMKLKKNNTYVVRLRHHVQEILGDLAIFGRFSNQGTGSLGLVDRRLDDQVILAGGLLGGRFR